MKNRELDSKIHYLEESLKDIEAWQQRHEQWQHRRTSALCSDCNKEGVHKIRTIDGITVHACSYHVDTWLGCSCNGRIIGK